MLSRKPHRMRLFEPPTHSQQSSNIRRSIESCIVALSIVLHLLLAACSTTAVQWNESVLARNSKKVGLNPPLIIVPYVPEQDDPRGIYNRLAVELGAAGLRVQRTTALGDVNQTGSGFFVSAQGHILTAAHVVGPYDRMYAQVGNRDYLADVITFDEALDLALLQLNKATPKGIQPLTLAPRGARKIGQELFAIGYPVTELLGNNQKITKGIVSSETGLEDDGNIFQMSAEVQPGNSGGPVISDQGLVLGIVTKTLNPFRLALTTGGALPQNVNFAVKAEKGAALLKKADIAQMPFEAIDLSTAVTSVVKLRSRKNSYNTYYFKLNYVTGWELYHGFRLLKVQLYDAGSRELVMRYLCNIDPEGMFLTEDKGIKGIVEEMLEQPIFNRAINHSHISQFQRQQETDRAIVTKLIPQLLKCAKHLPQGSRNTAKATLYVTPKGIVRYPGLLVGGDETELISRQAYKRARDCAVPLLRKLRFAPAKGNPRFYAVPITGSE